MYQYDLSLVYKIYKNILNKRFSGIDNQFLFYCFVVQYAHEMKVMGDFNCINMFFNDVKKRRARLDRMAQE